MSSSGAGPKGSTDSSNDECVCGHTRRDHRGISKFCGVRAGDDYADDCQAFNLAEPKPAQHTTWADMKAERATRGIVCVGGQDVGTDSHAPVAIGVPGGRCFICEPLTADEFIGDVSPMAPPQLLVYVITYTVTGGQQHEMTIPAGASVAIEDGVLTVAYADRHALGIVGVRPQRIGGEA